MLFLRLLLSEFRFSRGRLAIFASCLALGVAAVVATHALAEGVDRGVRRESRQLLAADLAVSSQNMLSPKVHDAVEALSRERGGQVTPVVELLGLSGRLADSGAVENTVLCEIKAVGAGYPFYGEVETDPPTELATLLARGIVAEDALFSRLGLQVGDPIVVGQLHTIVAARLISEPDRLSAGLSLGPRLLIAHDRLAATGLQGFGARASYKLLVGLNEAVSEEVDVVASELRKQVGSSYVRVQSYTQAQPAVRNGLDQLRRFLSLVSLLSLLLGGLGTSRAVALWIEDRGDDLTTLRCLGLRPWQAARLYGMLVTAFALAASTVGALLGLLVLLWAPRWELLAAALGDLQLQPGPAILRGLMLGTAIGCLFSLPALAQITRIPPARAFRRDAEQLALSRWGELGILALTGAGIVFLVVAETGEAELALRFVLGLALCAVALIGAAFCLVHLVRRLPLGAVRSLSLRYALGALTRPGLEQIPALLAVGLATTLFSLILFVEQRIDARLRADLPEDAPTMFLLDVQEDQWPPIEVVLEEHGATSIRSVPVITARIRSIDGVAVRELARREPGQTATANDGPPAGGERRERWALSREQRLTMLRELPADNRIVAGTLWNDPANFELAVEEEFAADLGVVLGSRIEFDVQGVPIQLLVTSLRTVNWQSFGINFFLVAEPGSLEGAPSFRLVAARVPADEEQAVQDSIAALYSNVSPIRVRDVLERVTAVLSRLRFAIHGVGTFVLLSAIAVLAGTVAAGAATRRSEVALLRTLGMGRRRIREAWAAEQAAQALVASGIGVVTAWGTAWWLCVSVLEIEWEQPILSALGALVVCVAVAVIAGALASEKTLAVSPLITWREE